MKKGGVKKGDMKKALLSRSQVEAHMKQTMREINKEKEDEPVPTTYKDLEERAKQQLNDEKWWVRLADRFPLTTYCAGKGDLWDKKLPLADYADFSKTGQHQEFLHLCFVYILGMDYSFPKEKWGMVVGFSKQQTFFMPFFGAVVALSQAYDFEVWAVIPSIDVDAKELTICWGVKGSRGFLVQRLEFAKNESRVSIRVVEDKCMEKPAELNESTELGSKLFGSLSDLVDQHFVNSKLRKINPTITMSKVESSIKKILGKEDTSIQIPDREIQRLVKVAGLTDSRPVRSGVLWTDGTTEILIKDAYRNFRDFSTLRSKLDDIPSLRKKRQEKDQAMLLRKSEEERENQKIVAQKELEETRLQLQKVQQELDEAKRLEELRQSEELRLAQEIEDKRKAEEEKRLAEEAELEELIKLEQEEKIAKAKAEEIRQEQERIRREKAEESRREQERIKEAAELFARTNPPAPKPEPEPPPPAPPPEPVLAPVVPVKRDIQAEIWQFIKNGWFEGKSEIWMAEELNRRGLKDASTPYVTEQHVKLAISTMEKNGELTFEAEQAFLQAQMEIAELGASTPTVQVVTPPREEPPAPVRMPPKATSMVVPSSVMSIIVGPFSEQQKLKALSAWALKDNGEVANTCLGVLSDPLMPDDTKLPILLSLLEH